MKNNKIMENTFNNENSKNIENVEIIDNAKDKLIDDIMKNTETENIMAENEFVAENNNDYKINNDYRLNNDYKSNEIKKKNIKKKSLIEPSKLSNIANLIQYVYDNFKDLIILLILFLVCSNNQAENLFKTIFGDKYYVNLLVRGIVFIFVFYLINNY